MLRITKGNHTKVGNYVCYVDHDFLYKYPDKIILMWIGEKWGYGGSDQNYRGKVYGWVGPLPTPTLDNLGVVCVKYAISKMPEGLNGTFLYGPYENLREAEREDGKEGQYIFELHLDQTSKAVGKWSEKKLKWLRKKK